MLITRRQTSTGVVLAPHGELDMGSASELERELRDAEHDGTARLIVDLRELESIDCSGLYVLLDAQRRLAENGSEFAIVPGPEPVQRVLELTGAIDRFAFDRADRVGVQPNDAEDRAGRPPGVHAYAARGGVRVLVLGPELSAGETDALRDQLPALVGNPRNLRAVVLDLTGTHRSGNRDHWLGAVVEMLRAAIRRRAPLVVVAPDQHVRGALSDDHGRGVLVTATLKQAMRLCRAAQ